MRAESETPEDVAAVAGVPVAREAASGTDGVELMEVEHLSVLFPLKQGLVIDRTIGHGIANAPFADSVIARSDRGQDRSDRRDSSGATETCPCRR